MDLKEVIRDLNDDFCNQILLEKLGDCLRDESTRSSLEIQQFIPIMLTSFGTTFQDFFGGAENGNVVLENLRVLINTAANNDHNRELIASMDSDGEVKFWNMILKLITVNDDAVRERLLMFLTQFVRNTELKEKFCVFFYDLKLDHQIMTFMIKKFEANFETNLEALDERYELISLILENCNTKIVSDEFYKSKSGCYIDFQLTILECLLRKSSKLLDIELDESVISDIITTLYYLTFIESPNSLDNYEVNKRILEILRDFPSSFENITSFKRTLFSCVGNITYMKSYDGSQDLNFALDCLKDKGLDPYVQSACMVSLGNYVTSKTRSDFLLETINKSCLIETLTDTILEIQFNDPIQYQSFHFFNNIMNSVVAHRALQNKNLIKISLLVVSNESYYKEVSDLYLKFIGKLLKHNLSDPKFDVLAHLDLWKCFDGLNSNREREMIYLLLVQALLKNSELNNSSFHKSLINNLVSIDSFSGNVDIQYILEKLQALGVFNQIIISKKKDLSEVLETVYNFDDEACNTFFQSYHNLISKFYEILKQMQSKPEKLIVLNNSKFVSATAISIMKSINDALTDSICDLCQSILILK
ncbi:uncharacterized protein PRCAT00003665001 [Priceomyces carsonii]|uniref:uncharacterized protein n=1 Tax=Priceomyces carsonii TaxID=28549 RepID=UPI002ED8D7F7|nr:unnamed protein product [Priceomyces carsonii]